MLSPELLVNEIKSMPDHAPVVRFDTSLNQESQYINFDYMGYQLYLLEQHGLAPADIEKLDVLFTHRTLGDDEDTNGRFEWQDERPEALDKFQIEIKIPKMSNKLMASKQATDTLVHETQHFADYVNGTYPYRMSRFGRFVANCAYISRRTPWEKAAYKTAADFRSTPGTRNATFVQVF